MPAAAHPLPCPRRALVLALGLLLAAESACGPPDTGPEGALVALPVLTGGVGRIVDDQGLTIVRLTNVTNRPLRWALQVVSADPGEQWASTSFYCDVIANGTAILAFSAAGAGSLVNASCFDLGLFGTPTSRVLASSAANGILTATAQDPAGGPIGAESPILADATVVALAQGFAFTLPAWPVRGRSAPKPPDPVHRFDDIAYARLTAGLETDVVAPAPGDFTDLILFTLDGSVGRTPPPRVSLGGYGELEGTDLFGRPTVTSFDFQYTFDCFSVLDLLDLSAGFAGTPGADGYLRLTAKPVGSGGIDVHDFAYGDGNGSRRRPVLGWAVERRGGAVVGRLLGELPARLAPFLGDPDPVFQAGP